MLESVTGQQTLVPQAHHSRPGFKRRAGARLFDPPSGHQRPTIGHLREVDRPEASRLALRDLAPAPRSASIAEDATPPMLPSQAVGQPRRPALQRLRRRVTMKDLDESLARA